MSRLTSLTCSYLSLFHKNVCVFVCRNGMKNIPERIYLRLTMCSTQTWTFLIQHTASTETHTPEEVVLCRRRTFSAVFPFLMKAALQVTIATTPSCILQWLPGHHLQNWLADRKSDELTGSLISLRNLTVLWPITSRKDQLSDRTRVQEPFYFVLFFRSTNDFSL